MKILRLNACPTVKGAFKAGLIHNKNYEMIIESDNNMLDITAIDSEFSAFLNYNDLFRYFDINTMKFLINYGE